MMDPCDCPLCRRGVRLAIEQTYQAEREWLGAVQVHYRGRFDWCPWPFFKSVFAEMVLLGILIKSCGAGDQFPRFLLARLTVPIAARKGGEG